MFYLKYLWAELSRRLGKTLTISLGLALSSAIIIIIIAVSQSLSSAQDKVLNPLQNVGTDIMVTRSVSTSNMMDLDEATRTELMSESRISTDLSKLGNPGDQFVNDSFLSGTLLTFASDENTKKLDLSLVKKYATGLILNVTHQEGKIPQVTATIQTGGEDFEVSQKITSEQSSKFREAMDQAQEAVRAKGLDPRSEEGRAAMDAAIKEYAPEMSTTFRTPNRTYTQDVGSISTDIKTTNFTVGGVDTTKTDIGLILPDQITDGKYFDGEVDQVLINKSYADKNNTKVGDKISINKKELIVTGIIDPKLYTNTADMYVPIVDLQNLAGKSDRINVILVKSTNANSVSKTSESLANLFTGAKITDATSTAKEVSGSLVNASNLVNKFIGLVSILVVLASFIIVSLLTLLSVNKRVREIGTLKALGWSNGLVTRQIILENLVLGIFGAIIGIGLGVLAIYLINHYNITFSANFANQSTGEGGGGFMRRFAQTTQNNTATSVKLNVEYSYIIMLLGVLTAIIGSFVSGTVAAFKSAKMKPQEALRKLE
ncbi:MAG: Integral membrane protein [uncultured bacterium]|nr:MAG: Integral membrane protein [uncultured bacterium]